nr:chitinase [uncultured bacterium]
MRQLTLLLATAAAAFTAANCAPPARTAVDSAGASRLRVVGYLASWGVNSKGTRIADLPARDLSHIFYAFGLIDKNGRAVLGDPCVDIGLCRDRGADSSPPPNVPVDANMIEGPLAGNFAALKLLKARNPHLKLLISIGGWTGSGRFSDAALTESSRRLFTESALALFIRRWPDLFDGIDIDWEFPVAGGLPGNVERPVDRENFTLLLADLRRALDAQGARDKRHYELTIAASTRAPEIANVDLRRIEPLLDFINVMTYDYHSAPGKTNFNSPLRSPSSDPTPGWNVDASMRSFIDGGVPAAKLLVGIPFYGHAYGQVASVNGGLFQPGTENPPRWKQGDGDWRVLAQTRLKDPRYVRHWEPTARVPWLYDASSGTWVSYDDPESVAAKAAYARERGLGGVVIWELGGDDGALMRAITASLHRGN